MFENRELGGGGCWAPESCLEGIIWRHPICSNLDSGFQAATPCPIPDPHTADSFCISKWPGHFKGKMLGFLQEEVLVGQNDAHPLPGFEEVSVAKGRGLWRPPNARQGYLSCASSS